MERQIIANFPRIDLNDPDEVEILLIEWAHKVSLDEDSRARAVGRIIKHIVPAFCAVLKDENHRSDSTKGDVINGLMNASSLMLSLVIRGCVKEGRESSAVDGVLEGLREGITQTVCRMEKEKRNAKNMEN